MRTVVIATAIALGLAPAAMAQQQTSPSPTPPSATADAASEAKFKAADKNSNGTLEAAELDAHKSVIAQVDTDRDGKLSRTEFLAGVKAGHSNNRWNSVGRVPRGAAFSLHCRNA